MLKCKNDLWGLKNDKHINKSLKAWLYQTIIILTCIIDGVKN